LLSAVSGRFPVSAIPLSPTLKTHSVQRRIWSVR
jgi:hypothetical protein